MKNNEYGYRSESHTKDDLQYLRARYYDTKAQIFMQEDTYQGEVDNPTTKNRYLYALNNPYKYSDLSGHYVVWAEEPGVTFRHSGGMLFSAAKEQGISYQAME